MASGVDVKDLGILQGPVLVFGGAYSNLQALQELLRLAGELHIPPERVIHTGDVVAYCGQPLETTELLRSSGVHCLMGNCEESIGIGKTDCGCGFPEDSACNEYSVNWYAHVTNQLKGHPEINSWMGSLPRRIEFTLGGRRLAVVHGSPRNISEFIWPSASDAELFECFKVLPPGIDGVICGHSGIPFARLLPCAKGSPRLWLNGGVIGMPANDGTQRVWYAVLRPTPQQIKVSVLPYTYDTKAAVAAIHAHQNLVRGYADALLSGVWPSHDILPVEEQMATGVALQESHLMWKGTGENDSPKWPSRSTVALAMSLIALASAFVVVGARRRASGCA